MKLLASHCFVISALCLSVPHLSTAQEDRGVKIRTAVEIEFETERGRSYHIQGSRDMVNWEDVVESVPGHGGRDGRILSTKDDGHKFFRVVVTEIPSGGPAPSSVAGLTLSLDDSPGGDLMQFTSETEGVDLGVNPDPFTYILTRTGPDTIKIETKRAGATDRRDVYTLVFTVAAAGTWVRDEFRGSELKDRDVGVFTVVNGTPGGGTPPGGNPPGTGTPPAAPTEVPAALAGLAYLFQSSGQPDRLEFTSATSGTEFSDDVNDDEPNQFTYTYAMSNPATASLVVTFKPDRWDEYTLVFTSPSQGTFVRREFKDGALDDTDSGAFSSVILSPITQPNPPSGGTTNPPSGGGTPPPDGTTPPPTGETPPPPNGSAAPPASLVGLSYSMNDGGAILTRLVITSATAGTEFDDSDPTQFTYAYTVTGANTASLVLTFKTDKWDEYDLTFTAGTNGGTFVRREFDNDELKDTDSGTFTGASAAP
jgi:hypothetical protein